MDLEFTLFCHYTDKLTEGSYQMAKVGNISLWGFLKQHPKQGMSPGKYLDFIHAKFIFANMLSKLLLFDHLIHYMSWMTSYNLSVSFSPAENLYQSANIGMTLWMTGHLENIHILLAHTSLFSPMSALLSSKLLSTSRIWLPSQSRTEGLKGADGRVSTEPAIIYIEKSSHNFMKHFLKLLLV